MAQLGFAVAGAAVGSLFGMPQLGWIAGAAIGGLLFPASGSATVTWSSSSARAPRRRRMPCRS